MKNIKKRLLYCVLILLAYFAIAGIFYFAAGEQLYIRDAENPIISVEGDRATPEITKDFSVVYEFNPGISIVDNISLRIATYARENKGSLIVRMKDTSGTVLHEERLEANSLADSEYINISMGENAVYDVMFHTLLLEICSEDMEAGSAVAPWYNSKTKTEGTQLYFNGEAVEGTLCINCNGRDFVWTGQIYWPVITVVAVLIMICMAWTLIRDSKGKRTVFFVCHHVLKKYRFLIKQLVSRDFTKKYKRSVLGVLWSFISPLLTMLIEYVVFSNIFKNDIENFPVYLMSGHVLFNFFSEAVGLSLTSIVENAPLITKVYVPKYIYPFTRVISSMINMLISLGVLLIICVATGSRFTKAFLLIPFPLVCVFVFSLGIGLLLSTSMVYFRDTQFLWQAFSLIWMYATPIFYPVSIIPNNFMILVEGNPMYYYLSAFRRIVMEGKSPEPKTYLYGFVISVVAFLIGLYVFRKKQDEFILYL